MDEISQSAFECRRSIRVFLASRQRRRLFGRRWRRRLCLQSRNCGTKKTRRRWKTRKASCSFFRSSSFLFVRFDAFSCTSSFFARRRGKASTVPRSKVKTCIKCFTCENTCVTTPGSCFERQGVLTTVSLLPLFRFFNFALLFSFVD